LLHNLHENPTMNIKALQAFTAVMEEGSIGAAAKKVSLSQPALSRILAQLESEVELPLFDRSRRRLRPTAAAHVFLNDVRRIIDEWNELPRIAKRIGQGVTDRLRILTMDALAPSLVMPAIGRFAASAPQVKSTLNVISGLDWKLALQARAYDLSIAVLIGQIPGLVATPLCRLRAEVLLPPNHKLARHKRLNVEHLAKERLIGMGPDQLLRRQMDDLFLRAGIEPNYAIETTSATLAAQLVVRGAGLAVTDRLLCGALGIKGYELRPIDPPIWITIGTLHHADTDLNAMSHNFIACMLATLKSFGQQRENRSSIQILR
jgi:DNA-binding transcriptional LysR family regulator